MRGFLDDGANLFLNWDVAAVRFPAVGDLDNMSYQERIAFIVKLKGTTNAFEVGFAQCVADGGFVLAAGLVDR
jgi:hypothetical protein